VKTNNMFDVNPIRPARAFVYSSGALLLAWALALFISCATDQRSIHPHDPIFLLSLPACLRILAGMELAVAAVCLLSRNVVLPMFIILWFAASLLFYRLGMALDGVVGGFYGYLGNLPATFGVSNRFANALFEVVPLYLLAGGLTLAVWLWWYQRQRRLHPVVKMPCPACGTRVEFASRDAGRQISCPQCQASITLRKPENLKMACFFCKEHIEFPAHAIGQKVPCPHCAKTITLLQPR
jgi:predicted RNA-binding Zn-ribbon protein involved in translation (DUF1610 family)